MAVLFLHRPQQSTRLVQVHVVGPTVERGKTLQSRSRAATAVGDAVRARTVPGEADEERSVVTVVSRPPILRVGHHLTYVALYRLKVEGLELFGVVEILIQWIRQR